MTQLTLASGGRVCHGGVIQRGAQASFRGDRKVQRSKCRAVRETALSHDLADIQVTTSVNTASHSLLPNTLTFFNRAI